MNQSTYVKINKKFLLLFIVLHTYIVRRLFLYSYAFLQKKGAVLQTILTKH